jgi:hypothetical protein
MQVASASGVFTGAPYALLYQNVADGKGFVSLKLVIPHGQTFVLPVSQDKELACGKVALTEPTALGDDQKLVGEFLDFSRSQNHCFVAKGQAWQLRVELRDANGQRSSLSLEGDPQTLFVTF